MRSILFVLILVTFAGVTHAFTIETEEGRRDREQAIERIRSVFDFSVVSEAVKTLVRERPQVEGVSISRASLGDVWTPHDRQFRSGAWWLSYEGGDVCFLTVYFDGASKSLDSEGDTALTFVLGMTTEKVSEGDTTRDHLVSLVYRSHSVSSDHIWISP